MRRRREAKLDAGSANFHALKFEEESLWDA